jgi:hypothetical protein
MWDPARCWRIKIIIIPNIGLYHRLWAMVENNFLMKTHYSAQGFFMFICCLGCFIKNCTSDNHVWNIVLPFCYEIWCFNKKQISPQNIYSLICFSYTIWIHVLQKCDIVITHVQWKAENLFAKDIKILCNSTVHLASQRLVAQIFLSLSQRERSSSMMWHWIIMGLFFTPLLVTEFVFGTSESEFIAARPTL